MIQAEKKAAIYCRVSTDDQNCERQLHDLTAFAKRAKYKVVGIFLETASGAKPDRIERAKVLKLAQARKIDAILVTELTRWGRSTIDLLETLEQLNKWNVSVIAQTGSQFDLSTAQGKMITGVLSVLSQFERDLISERTKSGLQAAVARGKKLGRQSGQNPSDKYANNVLKHLADGRSYRWIAHEMQISPTSVMASDMALRTNSDRIYLDVPFAQKDPAKALGAKWDRTEKSWYVPADISLEPFQQWMEPKQTLHIEPAQNPELEFAKAIKSAGLVLDGMPIIDGKLHRVSVEGDQHSQKSGSYVGFLDGHPAGYINNYKTGYEGSWKSKQRQNSIGTKDGAILEAEALERKAARGKEQVQKQKEEKQLVNHFAADSNFISFM